VPIAAAVRPVDHWLKIRNPETAAVQREAEEDWGNKRWSHAQQ
jgi:hypothetical protein